MASIGFSKDGILGQHLVVPIALVLVLGILILPMPTPVLDVNLALNITLSLIVLFVSIYVGKPLQFSAYPAILLITTLYRLAMNVASTRLILLNGDQGLSAAGAIIQAFGEFVVGGNFAIGIVIFILISIVNLKVITKGSGRIAEVAARFTLDAMPGKQMSIDSDLNAGLINEDEAKARRKELSQEAEFYGAMDGAAKFVSGDAAAGLFITGVNILGGLFIGIVQKEMDWMTAAETYTLLTIGDGLVTQIPAIIISTSAGLIVTRAASAGEDMGNEIVGQMGRSEKPLAIASAVSIGFAIMPGLPFVPFLVLGGLTGVLAYVSNKANVRAEEREKEEEIIQEVTDGPRPGSTEEVKSLLPIDTLELEVGYELVPLVDGGGDLIERIRSLRRQFAVDFGFIVPPIHIRDNVRIQSTEYKVLLKGTEIADGTLKPHHLLAMDPGNATEQVQGAATKEPAFGLDALWIAESDKEKAQFAGYTVVDLSTVLTTHLTEVIKAHAHEILGRQETQELLDHLSVPYPKVVEELVPGLLTLGQVQQVLAGLLREGISIRDLRTILETLSDWAPTVKIPEKLGEAVRRRISRTIVGQYLSEEGVLSLLSMSPSVERTLSDCLQETDEGSMLALDPSYAQLLINKLNVGAERFMDTGQTPVMLCAVHIRPALYKFIERFVPGYAVLSHQEIPPSVKVQSVGVISMDELHQAQQLEANA